LTATRTYSRSLPAPTEPPAARASLHVADLLLPVGVALWVVGISRTDASVLGPYGLPAVLPVIFYAGIAVLIVSAAAELFYARISTWRMSLHAAALATMLYGTAPLVYSQGRYTWLYKTIGVVQYINAHGHLNSQIDVYQNWPGFFALAAWFDKVAGVASPLAYAKWAQLAFELAALPLLYLVYEALRLTARQGWVAVLLFLASNWIAQDYFSPQALGTLLSLGIMALAMRWLYLGRPPPTRPPRTSRSPGSLEAAESTGHPVRPGMTRFAVPVAICAVFTVLTFTHQLSPYMLVVQVSGLAVLRLLRPRWLPLALAAIAVGYLLPRFAYVNSHFGVLKSLGDFFSNAAPPSFDVVSLSPEQLVIQRCAEALSVGIWGLAILGAWRRRRSGRSTLGLVVLAFSPIVLLALQAYGNEGILRVYLFSLPWCAALAAVALVPPRRARSHRTQRAMRPEGPPAWSAEEPRREIAQVSDERPRTHGTVRVPMALMVAVALFFPAFYGDDASNVMSKSEVTTITSFFRHAAPGTLYCAIDHSPVAETARYNLFPVVQLFGTDSLLGTKPLKSGIDQKLARIVQRKAGLNAPVYVMFTSSMVAYNDAYQLVQPANITQLQQALGRSPYWKLLVHSPGTWIYQIQPTLPTTPEALGNHRF
jgi:hypothetical protein